MCERAQSSRRERGMRSSYALTRSNTVRRYSVNVYIDVQCVLSRYRRVNLLRDETREQGLNTRTMPGTICTCSNALCAARDNITTATGIV